MSSSLFSGLSSGIFSRNQSYKGQKAVLIDEGNSESIYVFDGSEDEVTEEDLLELRSRAPQYQRKKNDSGDENAYKINTSIYAGKKEHKCDTFIEKKLENGESLQSLALTYSCPVS